MVKKNKLIIVTSIVTVALLLVFALSSCGFFTLFSDVELIYNAEGYYTVESSVAQGTCGRPYRCECEGDCTSDYPAEQRCGCDFRWIWLNQKFEPLFADNVERAIFLDTAQIMEFQNTATDSFAFVFIFGNNSSARSNFAVIPNANRLAFQDQHNVVIGVKGMAVFVVNPVLAGKIFS